MLVDPPSRKDISWIYSGLIIAYSLSGGQDSHYRTFNLIRATDTLTYNRFRVVIAGLPDLRIPDRVDYVLLVPHKDLLGALWTCCIENEVLLGGFAPHEPTRLVILIDGRD
jgi:hypothetical protein